MRIRVRFSLKHDWKRLPLIRSFAALSPHDRREAFIGYLFIMPWLVGFIVFFAGPILASFALSFTRWNIVGTPEWVGFRNYERIFTDDPMFIKSVKVTLTYALFYLPLEVSCGIGLAVAMNQKLRGIGIFRTLFYLPSIVPKVAAALIWVWMLNRRYGAINTLLSQVDVTGPNWLGNPKAVLPSLIMIALWGVGGGAVIYLAGLQNIPQQLYEAARVDGASRIRRFIHVTLPMLTPTIFFQVVLGLIGAFQTFTPAYVAAGRGGGPLQSGLFYMLYIYNKSFESMRMGYGSALAWIMTVFIMLVTILVFRSSKYWVYYAAERDRR